ncbi:FtsW/RodA/SpoVE family cell cycle protein [Aerococcaceae bacterium NML180378]|nr:FtsW/RodA/SpoVE family cell cycle protein [Aerococcaceae bacterium NML180378]MDO4775201.1 FtsW/RodA/SpoVE family cell cycle protein [Aerococcaceae bacterium]
MQQSYRRAGGPKRLSSFKEARDNFIKYLKRLDMPLLVLMFLIIIFGLVMVYSTTIFYADGTVARSFPIGHLFKQVVAVIIGSVGLFALLLVHVKHYGDYKTLMLVHWTLTLILLVTVGWGTINKGAKSWLALGTFNFQVSEFTKISIMLLMSNIIYYTYREYRAIKGVWRDNRVWGPTVSIVVAMVLIGVQPDLGMLIIITGTMFTMLIVNRFGTKFNIALYVVIIGVYGFLQVLAWKLGDLFSRTGMYQLKRLGSFIDPFKYAEDAGYQLTRAYIAFSRGGWFGVGIGQGLTNRAQLPERHTDFILAIVVEETGFVGACVLLGLLFALIIRLFLWAYKSKNFYHRCVLSGAGTLYLVQTLVNVGGALGLLPLTGVTLPFVSYGGSSMIMCLLLMGVAQRIIIAEKNQMEIEKEAAYGI